MLSAVNALQVIAEDAERIAAPLVPSVNKLPQVVGVLVKQVEQLAGGELKNLADEALGITPEAPAEGEGVSQAEVQGLQQQLSEQATMIKELREQLAGGGSQTQIPGGGSGA